MEVRCRNSESLGAGVPTAFSSLQTKSNLVTSCGSTKERAETERVHPATVYPYDRLVSTTGSVDRVKNKRVRKRKMSSKNVLGLFFYKTITLRHKKLAGRATSAAIMVVFVFHSVLVLHSSRQCCLI